MSKGRGSNAASARCSRSWRRPRSPVSTVAWGPAASSARVIAADGHLDGKSVRVELFEVDDHRGIDDAARSALLVSHGGSGPESSRDRGRHEIG